MSRKLYPIGIQTFERIRKEDMLYVDKTEYVYHMTHTDGKYFFLSRPRRFGKSLLTSTFRSYFEGRRDLFKGLPLNGLKRNGLNIQCCISVWLEENTWIRTSWNAILTADWQSMRKSGGLTLPQQTQMTDCQHS